LWLRSKLMLLNTVVICINQCLPIAVLWVLLQQRSYYCGFITSKWSRYYSAWVAILGLGLSIVFLTFAGTVSQWFDYSGLEVIQMVLLFLLYVAMIMSLLKPTGYYAASALVLVTVIYFSNFLTYLVGFASADAFHALFIGTILGIGICLSFSVLLYFFLSNATIIRASWVFLGLFALHAGSKVSLVVDLGSQIDLFPTTVNFYDAKELIDEHSVFGRLLKVLVGYESNPSGLSFFAFSASALITLLLAYKMQILSLGSRK
jgi:high-affinity iron transporter